MNILLINESPLVSRLLALCTREAHMVLEEVKSVDAIQHKHYDVVFVDEGSYEGDVLKLSDILTIGKKVLLSNADVEIKDFDLTIQKPFLPSQILEVLANAEKLEEVSDDSLESVTSIFPLSAERQMQDEEEITESEDTIESSGTQVLDEDELDRIKALLASDDEMEICEEELSEEEIEVRKIEAIKKQLIADGLEIVAEEEIVDELSMPDEIVIFPNNDNLETSDEMDKEKMESKHKEKKSLDFSEEELERIEDAVQVAIATLKRKKMKKLLKGREIKITLKLEDSH